MSSKELPSGFPTAVSLLKYAPGVVLGVWKGSRELLIDTSGVSNIFTREPITEDLHFRIGSITKTFTATVILYLAKKGYIDPKQTAYHYFKKYKSRKEEWFRYLPRDVTVEQLGNMTSGLFNYTESPGFATFVTDHPEYEVTDVNTLLSKYALNAHTTNYFLPGQGWYYSNTNYVLLGQLAQYVSGLDLETLYRRIIFEPLRLRETSVAVGVEIPPPYSQGYMFGYEDNRSPQDVLRQVTHNNPSWANSAGFMISTLRDLGKYIKPFATGQLIGKEMEEYRKTTFVDVTKGEYGFGIGKLDGWLGHNGEIVGYQSAAFYSPERDISFVVLANLYSDLSGKGPADVIAQEIINSFK